MPSMLIASLATFFVVAMAAEGGAGPYISTTGAIAVIEWTAFACGLLCSIVCFVLIWQHINHYPWPEMQKGFIRVLLLPPTVATSAILTVLWPGWYEIFELAVSFVEPIVFSSFIACMFIFVGGERATTRHVEDLGDVGLQRACCLFLLGCKAAPRYKDGIDALHSYKWRVAQFCFLKPLLSMLKIVLHYTKGPKEIALILSIVMILSTVLGMTSILVLEKKVLHHHLQGWGAAWKFWSIKAVVLLLIVQGQIINMTANATHWESAPGKDKYADFTSVDAMQRTLQFLVLFELLIIVAPLFILSFAVSRNLHWLSKNPSYEANIEGKVNSASVAEAVDAVFFGWIDCAGFIWVSLFCGSHDTLEDSSEMDIHAGAHETPQDQTAVANERPASQASGKQPHEEQVHVTV
mmetsp:Transcript_100969/g.174432  ORF Transcript_100969/g.174432 Transcript_100969/m.174432 type:complete len:408 (-) Transcript_100969:37-1260(-)